MTPLYTAWASFSLKWGEKKKEDTDSQKNRNILDRRRSWLGTKEEDENI